MELFYRRNCSECTIVNREILPELEAEFADLCFFKKFDVADRDHYLLLSAYLEFFGVSNNAPVYIVVGGNRILSGTAEIRLGLRDSIAYSLAHPAQSSFDYRKLQASLLEERAARFTWIAIFVAGMIDGINPCIFATLVFFLSLLAVTKVSGQRMLAVGGVYCFACFLTYFALGFGILNFLNFLSGYSWLRSILEWGTVMVLCAFAAISFIDAFRFAATRKSDRIWLQLPDGLKMRIHSIMRDKLRMRYLLSGVFIIGILVTVIESVCTGQVYIPTLVFLTREKGVDIWLFYLLLYNIAFIIPLLVVFGIAWRGTSTMSFVAWSKRHVVYGKIALGVFFLVMAFLLLFINTGVSL